MDILVFFYVVVIRTMVIELYMNKTETGQESVQGYSAIKKDNCKALERIHSQREKKEKQTETYGFGSVWQVVTLLPCRVFFTISECRFRLSFCTE